MRNVCRLSESARTGVARTSAKNVIASDAPALIWRAAHHPTSVHVCRVSELTFFLFSLSARVAAGLCARGVSAL